MSIEIESAAPRDECQGNGDPGRSRLADSLARALFEVAGDAHSHQPVRHLMAQSRATPAEGAFRSTGEVGAASNDVGQVNDFHVERAALLSALVRAEDDQRARIAANVHEDALQAMGAVTVHLTALRSRLSADLGPHDLVDALGREAVAATERLRHLISHLQPADDGVPLAEALRAQAAIVLGPATTWVVDDTHAGEELRGLHKVQCLSIAREALINVRTHARASEVRIVLRGDASGLHMLIGDNGLATEASTFVSPVGHHGLATMRHRADAVGGWCCVEPLTPHGCVVRCWVPRPRAPERL